MELTKNPTLFPSRDAHFLLDGPVGNLEVLSTTPKKEAPKGIGIVCHPHPLHEGAMTNKVVYTVAKAFDQKGLRTLRFNFRGVGKSEGQFAEGLGETDDLLAILQWVQKTCPNEPIWLAGFSFGAFVAARAAAQWPVVQLFSIAPAVTRSVYQSLGKISCPWVIIQGDEDEVVPPQKVYEWYEKIKNEPGINVQLIVMPGATHYFHGRLIELRQLISDHFIDKP